MSVAYIYYCERKRSQRNARAIAAAILNAYQYRKSITTVPQPLFNAKYMVFPNLHSPHLYSKCPRLMNSPDRISGDGIDVFTVELGASIVMAEALIGN